ncbi:MAG: acyl-CoA thioesterase [Magnetospiraceae bacterium]
MTTTPIPVSLDLRDPDVYPYWTEDLIRFADLDRLNHVNNVAFATYAESGRVAFAEASWPGSTDGSGVGWVIVRLTVNFLAAAYYPNSVRIGTRVLSLGRTSVVLGQGMFTKDRCFGTTESVMVWADTKSEKSLPLSEDLRRALERYMTDKLPD